MLFECQKFTEMNLNYTLNNPNSPKLFGITPSINKIQEKSISPKPELINFTKLKNFDTLLR